MNTQPNFTSILDKPIDDFEAQKPPPVGNYLALIAGPEVYSKVGANETDIVKWPVKLIQPQGDVDVNALNEALALKDGTSRSLGDIKMTYDAFLTDASIHIMRDNFLKNTLGIETTGKSTRQAISEAMGRQFIATIKHGLTKGDNPRVFATISDTAKV